MKRLASSSIPGALRPYPFEVWTVGGALLTILLLRCRGLDYGWNTVAHTLPALLKGLPRLLAIGLAAQLLATWLGGRRLGDYLRGISTWRWIVLWLRLWTMVAVQVYAYMWLKVSIPLVHARLLDVEIWRLDRWLHFGISPTVFAIELVAGTPLARAIDFVYGLWIPSIPLVFAFVFAGLHDGRKRNLALASAVLWTLGAWMYTAIPALGPCYASPDVMKPVAADMPSAVGTQQLLWRHYLGMVQSRGRQPDHFSPVLGVAAFPSLHVGAYALFALWCRRHSRRGFVPWTVATAVIFVGSLATGWHYAVDGYAGALLAWAAVAVADRFEPVEPPPVGRRREPDTEAAGADAVKSSERSGGGAPSFRDS